MNEIAFYSVSDERTYLGLVALINSLRRLEHDEPFYILDCGFTEAHREALASQATVVRAPESLHPTLLKTILPLRFPAKVTVILDADVIVLRRLDELITTAAKGRLVVFPNDRDRFHPEWESVTDAPLRRQRYVNAGHLVFPRDIGLRIFKRLAATMRRLGLAEATRPDGPPRAGQPSDPFFYTDQDVLNIILASEVDRADLEILDERAAAYAPFPGVKLEPASLACQGADGFQPYLLHHLLAKPWLAPLAPNVYSRALTSLLVGPQLAITPSPSEIPLRLRTGRLAALDRQRASIRAIVHARTRGKLGIRRRLASVAR